MPFERKLLCCLFISNKISNLGGSSDNSSRPASRITWAGSAISITSLYTRAKYRLPIDERDMITLSKSWSNVEASIEKAGVLMFMEIFEKSPHVRPAFQKFIGLDAREDLVTSSVFQTHGLIVMNAVNDIITGIYDRDDVVEQIIHQGRQHVRFQGMKSEFFWSMEKPFVSAIKSTLSGQMPHKLEQLYKKLIRFVLECLVAGFQMAQKENEIIREEKRKQRKENRRLNSVSNTVAENQNYQNMLNVPMSSS